MNHWFLVSRDVMWVIIFFMPLYMSGAAVYVANQKDNDLDGFRESRLMMGAILLQIALCGSLYVGLIK